MIIMKIDYTLSENDLLTHQLFSASKSKTIQKRRAKGKIFLLLIYMAMGFFIWDRNGPPTAAVFFVVCLPLYFVYALMERNQYVNHFKRYVAERDKDLLGRTTALTFTESHLEMNEAEKESIIPYSEIETIFEIGSLFSISLKNGQSVLIPKAGLSSLDETRNYLRHLASRLDIPLQEDLKWKWK